MQPVNQGELFCAETPPTPFSLRFQLKLSLTFWCDYLEAGAI